MNPLRTTRLWSVHFRFPRLCFRLVLIWVLAGFSFSAQADVSFVRVWPRWQDKDVFKRISEYFTGRENTGREIVFRSQPAKRVGFYFLVRVKNPKEPLFGARFVLRVITPLSSETEEFTFPIETGPGEHVFDLGLTGTDWPGRKTHPVAWRLDLQSATGQTLAFAQSFLWSKPDK
jgi:hypothetical protein